MNAVSCLYITIFLSLVTYLLEFLLLDQEKEIQNLKKEKSLLLGEIHLLKKFFKNAEAEQNEKEKGKEKEEDESKLTEQEKFILQLKKEREALQQSLIEADVNVIAPKHEKRVHNKGKEN